MPKVFGIAATYSASDGRQFSEETTIDLRVFYESTSGNDLVVEQLRAIAESPKAMQG